MKIIQVLNIAIVLTLPLLFVGVINKFKAIWGGRYGASIIQPYFDFWRLLKKDSVLSSTTSFVFLIGPVLSLSSLIFASLIIPFGNIPAIIKFDGDFILFAYLFAFGKFFSANASMDTGSSFEGMGTSREVSFTSLIEPAFLIIMASTVYFSGVSSISDMSSMMNISEGHWRQIITVLIVIALFIMMLAEGCRLPVDDPNTHLELTMIHEVMILDNSGPDLAFLIYGAGLKMFLIALLIAAFGLHGEVAPIYAYPLTIVIVFVWAVVVSLVESLFARIRMSHVPDFILIMISISFIVLAGAVIHATGGIK